MRTGLFAVFIAATACGFSAAAEAAPRHQPGKGWHPQPRKTVIQPFGAPVFAGSPVTVINEAAAVPRTTTLNIVTHQTVVGIRPPPEAAPVLFIIPGDRQEARQVTRASAAIRSLGSGDTTTARIIVVR